MSNFPTIFDWLERFTFLRGEPATYLVIAAAAIVIIVWDWRISLLALAFHYLVGGLLFADILDPRLTVIKIWVGLFACLILYFTARQTNWGRLPADITAAEAIQLRQERQLRFGPYLLPSSTPFRIFLTLMVVLVVATIAQQPGYHLPAVPDHLNLAIFGLLGLGLLGMSLTSEPLRAGMALLLFMTGFELFYNTLEQSIAMLALLAIANLVMALAVAYLTQARHALPAIFD